MKEKKLLKVLVQRVEGKSKCFTLFTCCNLILFQSPKRVSASVMPDTHESSIGNSCRLHGKLALENTWGAWFFFTCLWHEIYGKGKWFIQSGFFMFGDPCAYVLSDRTHSAFSFQLSFTSQRVKTTLKCVIKKQR